MKFSFAKPSICILPTIITFLTLPSINALKTGQRSLPIIFSSSAKVMNYNVGMHTPKKHFSYPELMRDPESMVNEFISDKENLKDKYKVSKFIDKIMNSSGGYPVPIEILLNTGVKPSIENINTAIRKRYNEVLELLVACCPREILNTNDSRCLPPLYTAIETENIEAGRIIIRNIDNINRRATRLVHGLNTEDQLSGDTYLHYAAKKGNPAFIRLLVLHGAFIDSKNHDGNTPLHEAAVLGNEEAYIELTLNRADQHIKNKVGNTPSDYMPGYNLSNMMAANPRRARGKIPKSPAIYHLTDYLTFCKGVIPHKIQNTMIRPSFSID